MTEALLTGEPQTPTEGTTAAQAPAKDTSSVPEQGKQPSETPKDAAPEKGLLTKEPEKKAPTAPEKYDLKIEGDAKLSAPMQKGFEAAAKEVGLSNEAANKLLNSLVKSHQESQKQAIDAMKSEWAEATKANKEWGGDKLPETLAQAKQALTEFGTPELGELLDATGLSNNEHFIALLAKVQRKVGGDKVLTGSAPRGSEAELAKVFYPNMA